MATNYSGWEQILGGVLGMGIPDRAQITGQTWLIIQHNAPANPNMHQIWAATWKAGKNSQSITVYLNPALYAAGGAWDTFLSVPSANLSGVSAGNYGTLPMSPPTFTDAQLAVASVASWLNAATQRLSGLSTDVASGSSGFQGSGGQVFTNLLTRLRGVTDAAYTQMTSPVAYSDAIAAAGDSASRFLTSLWSAYTSWTQAPPSSPLGALVQVLQGIGGDPRHTSYGDLTTDAAWALVENAAKSQWLGTLTGPSGGFAGLDPLSQNALSMLTNQYATTTHVLDPLLGAASGPTAAGSSDPTVSAAGGPGNGAVNSGVASGSGPNGAPGVPGGGLSTAGGGPVAVSSLAVSSLAAAPGGGGGVPGGVPNGAPGVPGGGLSTAGGGPAAVSSLAAAPGTGGAGPGALVSSVAAAPGTGGAGPGALVSSVAAAPGGAGGAAAGVPGGGPVVSANFPGAATPGPAAGSVVNGGASALAPLPPVAGASPQPGAVVANQSLSAQAALLVPTALLTSGAAGTPAGSGTRGPGGSPGTVSGLGALLAASQLGVLSGAIGRGAASRVTRGGAASGGSSGQVAADGAAGGIAGQDINSAPVAGFSLGSDLNGPLLSQSAVPALAIRPGSPTVTVTAFNTKAVPSVPALPALPGGDSGSVLSTLAVPGGATAGMPGTLATGGGPGESAALAVQGAGTPGGMDAGAMSGAGGAFGAGGEAGLAAGPMFMMPGMMAGGGGEQGQERVRDAFAPEDEGFWGTEPGIPEVPITPDGQDDPEPDWPDTEYSPFEAIGIGADRRAGRRGKTRSDERVR